LWSKQKKNSTLVEMIREYKIRDKHNNEFIKNFIVYDINMEKVKDIWYSKSKKEIENNKYLKAKKREMLK